MYKFNKIKQMPGYERKSQTYSAANKHQQICQHDFYSLTHLAPGTKYLIFRHGLFLHRGRGVRTILNGYEHYTRVWEQFSVRSLTCHLSKIQSINGAATKLNCNNYTVNRQNNADSTTDNAT